MADLNRPGSFATSICDRWTPCHRDVLPGARRALSPPTIERTAARSDLPLRRLVQRPRRPPRVCGHVRHRPRHVSWFVADFGVSTVSNQPRPRKPLAPGVPSPAGADPHRARRAYFPSDRRPRTSSCGTTRLRTRSQGTAAQCVARRLRAVRLEDPGIVTVRQRLRPLVGDGGIGLVLLDVMLATVMIAYNFAATRYVIRIALRWSPSRAPSPSSSAGGGSASRPPGAGSSAPRRNSCARRESVRAVGRAAERVGEAAEQTAARTADQHGRRRPRPPADRARHGEHLRRSRRRTGTSNARRVLPPGGTHCAIAGLSRRLVVRRGLDSIEYGLVALATLPLIGRRRHPQKRRAETDRFHVRHVDRSNTVG